MSERPGKPYWVDELTRKHECFGYDEERSDHIEIKFAGRSLDLIVPRHAPPILVKTVTFDNDLLFLLGGQLDEEDEQGEIIEGGDGVLIVARRQDGNENSYWTLIWHWLYPQTLKHIEFPVLRG